MAKKPEPKVPVEELQKRMLEAPTEENPAQIEEDLVQAVVPVKEMPVLEKIVFRNQRDPGYPLDFHYVSATHPFKMYQLIDGKEYLLQREVIMNLEGCKENIEKYRRNSDGLPEIYVAGHRQHFVCERAR